jgi:hypothetical protein
LQRLFALRVENRHKFKLQDLERVVQDIAGEQRFGSAGIKDISH